MSDNTCIYITLGTIIIVFIAILLLLLSMDSIEPLEYGITYNKLSKYVSSEVYENGRYLIGPLTSFIVYPGYLVNIEFSNSHRADVNNLLSYNIITN